MSVRISHGPRAKASKRTPEMPEKFAPPEFLKVELALDLAGWKPALLVWGD